MIKATVYSDLRGLDRLEASVPKKTASAVMRAAEAFRDDIIHSWSPVSPSAPGNPPAVDTGNLDGSVLIDTGRDARGRFTSDANAVKVTVRVDTTKGPDPQDRGQYGGHLEYGTTVMDARPYFGPAAERLEAVYSHFFADIFR